MIDGRSFGTDETLQADMCIVGMGVAGITLAREFIGSPARILLVESGGTSPKPETQKLAEGEVAGQPYFNLDDSCKRAVGGSAWGWGLDLPGGRGGRLRALEAIDFEDRPEIPYSGWPMTLSDLKPYYQRAHETFEIGPYENGERNESTLDALLSPIQSDKVENTIFHFGDARLFTHRYPQNLIQASNISILTNTTVLELETNRLANHVRYARCQTLTGSSIQIESSHFIIAAGGIQTPRLLLLSNRNQSEGLGNQYDLVGRFFTEHIHNGRVSPKTGYLIPSGTDVGEKLRLYHEIQEVDGVPSLGYLTPKEDLLRTEGLSNYCCHFKPDSELDSEYNPYRFTEGYKSFRRMASVALGRANLPDRPLRRLWGAFKGIADVGRFIGDELARRTLDGSNSQVDAKPRGFVLFQMAEQIPNPESRVTLSSERDAFGQPRARLDWKLQTRDFRNIQRAQELVAAAIEDAGMGRFLVPSLGEIQNNVNGGGHHHMGTTRMSETPRDGVVDPDCKVYGVDNLHIAGPSVFPTSGCANPTLTIVALAIRLADHLQDVIHHHE